MATEYQKPSQQTLEFLRNGLIIFYPKEVAGIFNSPKELTPQSEWEEMGLPKYEFESYLLDIFKSKNPAFCASQVRRWLADPNVASNVPANLNELVAENEEAKALKAEHEAQRLKEQAAEALKKEAVKPIETPKIATPEIIPEEAAKGEVLTPTPEEAPPPEINAIGINFVRQRPNLFKQFFAQIKVSAIKAAAKSAFPQIQEQYGGNITTGIALFLKGVPSKMLLDKSSGLPDSASQLVANLGEIVARLESDNNLTRLIGDANGPVKDLQFTLGPLAETGVSEFTIYYSPAQPTSSVLSPEEGAPSVLSSLAWSLTKRVGGKYAQKALTSLISRAVAKGVAKAGTTLAAEAATTAAVEAGAATVGAEAGAAAGTALAPGVGTLIGLLVGLLIGATFGLIEKFFKWMKKNGQDVLFGSVAITAYGAFVGSPVLIYSGLGLGTISALSGGFKGFGKGFAKLGQTAMSGMTTLVLPAVGVPFLIALIATPLIIALIIFIINAGAYIVPPQTGTLPFGENPYIDITKTVVPSCRNRSGEGCVAGFPNVTYTINVHAKKGTLTNIHFSNIYNVVGEGNPPIPNPNVPEIANPPDSISPTKDYNFSYTLRLGPEYNNTIVTDVFTTTADVPEQIGFSAAASASVVTGNPPIDCPLLGGNILWYSYVPGDETSRRHGNNRYWGQGGNCNAWKLPQNADNCYGPSDPRASSNMCYNNLNGTCSYYGYAIDVFNGVAVFAPRIGGQPLTWSCSYAFSNGNGGDVGVTYICHSNQYMLVLTHMKNGARTGMINSGEQIGEIYNMGSSSHLHIEFAINGQYVKPEEYFCSP